MDMLWDWLNSWMGWLGIGGFSLTALAGLAWFTGLMPLIGAGANLVSAVLAPILGALSQGIVWFWQNVIWPGIWDILNDWVTIVTVLLMGAVLWFGVLARYEVKSIRLDKELSVCKVELDKARKPLPQVESPSWELPWPWKW